MSYSGASKLETRERSVSTAIDDLDNVIERIETYASRLATIADKIGGCTPTGVKESQGNPASIAGSMIESVNRRRSRLVDVANEIEASLNRIDNTL